MNFRAQDYYARPSRPQLAPGAIFLGVPIAFTSGERLPAVALAADGTFRHRDFADAWANAPEARRDEGLPVLVRAKARPVLVLRVGAAVIDRVYHQSVWVAPIFSVKDPPRRGPNVFPLPAWPQAGLRFAGFADLYGATMLPLAHIRGASFACTLSPAALALLLGALASWAEADPPPGAS